MASPTNHWHELRWAALLHDYPRKRDQRLRPLGRFNDPSYEELRSVDQPAGAGVVANGGGGLYERRSWTPSRRITAATAQGRLDPHNLGLSRHPSTGPLPQAAWQMHQLHDAASVLRSHPNYAAPRARTEAVLSLVRSGRFPLIEAPSPD